MLRNHVCSTCGAPEGSVANRDPVVIRPYRLRHGPTKWVCLWIPKVVNGGIPPRRRLGSAPQPMTVPTLRAWLSRLQASRQLAVVHRRVDPRFELTAVAKRLDGQRPVFFTRVGDYRIPVVAGIAASRRLLAQACG